MRRLSVVALFVVSGLSCMSATAQNNACSDPSKANTLYCTPILAVENLTAAPSGQIVRLVPPPFLALTSAVGTQISQVPTPSPASGVIFSFGAQGLTQERELGPIFSERPGTLGKHKLYLAFTYQFFQLDGIDQVPLKEIPLQINGCENVDSPSCGPFIRTQSRLDLKVHQFTSYATFGLSQRIDVSVAIPILDVRMGMRTTCFVCFQNLDQGGTLSFTPNTAAATSSGIGDMTFRLKGTVINGERIGLAAGVDVRVPTGDALNFLGSGAAGARPFLAFGYRRRISPHANIGYQANGSSILTSSDGVNAKHLPNSLNYAAGVDVSLFRWLSVTGDLLGQTFFNAVRVYKGSRRGEPDTACTAAGTLPCQGVNFNTNSFALGAKLNPVKALLISGNVLFKLDNNGLRYKPAPMIGISYTF